MSEEQVKRQLKKALRSFTPGSLLGLLAELYGEEAEKARRGSDETSYQQCRMVEATLIVMGFGIDAARPR